MTAPNGEAVVKVENLHKRFGQLEVLRGIDMEVDKGEVVVIFGRSGSGKSTLLRCVNFLEDPTAGLIEVAGIRLEGGHRTKGKREQIRQLRLKAGMVLVPAMSRGQAPGHGGQGHGVQDGHCLIRTSVGHRRRVGRHRRGRLRAERAVAVAVRPAGLEGGVVSDSAAAVASADGGPMLPAASSAGTR